MNHNSPTLLCLASYEKGFDFLREAKAGGARVLLLTLEKLADVGWPREAIDEVYYLPDMYNREAMVHAVSYLARTQPFDRIVALDDFDVETAAMLREHLRIPGMGDTTARFFRDKLAMRFRAAEHGLRVPPFCPILNYDQLHRYMAAVAPPWVLKPRSEASALGIKKVHSPDELWPALELLGDRQSFYVLEQYVPGEVYHVDAIVYERAILFAEAHQYSQPPLDLTSQGGLFLTRTLARGSEEARALKRMNRDLLSTLGLMRGVTHTEFIRSHADGRFYFLETAARVGGANIADMVEAATGINLWREWAKLELDAARGDFAYELPPHRRDYAAVLISLARQEWPDTSAYTEPEIVWRLNRKHHAGLIVASGSHDRISELLHQYTHRFTEDFMAVLPPAEKPTS